MRPRKSASHKNDIIRVAIRNQMVQTLPIQHQKFLIYLSHRQRKCGHIKMATRGHPLVGLVKKSASASISLLGTSVGNLVELYQVLSKIIIGNEIINFKLKWPLRGTLVD